MNLGTLFYKITGDSSQLQGELKKGEKKVKGFAGKIKGALKAIGFAAVAVGVTKVTKSLIKAASDAEEVQNKFDVVFKGLEKESSKIASNLAKNYGLAKTESKELLSSTADLLNGFGIGKREALELSNNVQKLAVDLGSFNNVSSARASDALTKALLGEREAVKQLGIAITESGLKRFAEDAGKNYEAMTKGEKAILTYKLAVEQSQNAIGDWGRSQDSFANSMKKLKSRFKDILETLGKKLLPIATKFLHALVGMAEGFSGLPPVIQTVITSLGVFALALVVGKILGIASALKKAKMAFIAFGSGIKKATQRLGGFKTGLIAVVGLAVAAGRSIAKWQSRKEDLKSQKIADSIWEEVEATKAAMQTNENWNRILSDSIKYYKETGKLHNRLGDSFNDWGMAINASGKLVRNYGDDLQTQNNNIEAARRQLEKYIDTIDNSIESSKSQIEYKQAEVNWMTHRIQLKAEEDELTQAETRALIKQNKTLVEHIENIEFEEQKLKALIERRKELAAASEDVESAFTAEQQILQTALSGIKEIEGRHKYLGDEVDVTAEKINLFNSILIQAYKNGIPLTSDAVETLQRKLKELKSESKDTGEETTASFQEIYSGITGFVSAAISSIQSLQQANIDAMNNELAVYDRRVEAAENAASKIQKSENDLLRAKKNNLQGMLEKQKETAQTTAAINTQQAIDEVEAEILKNKQIENIEKQRAKAAYNMKIAEWKMNKAMIWANASLAVMNLMAGLPTGAVGTFFKIAQIPLIMGVAAKQFSVMQDSKPHPPQFAQGATNIQRDQEATVHKGEMVLDPITADSIRRGKTTIGGQGTSGQDINLSLILDSDKLYEAQWKASKDGRYKIAREAVV